MDPPIEQLRDIAKVEVEKWIVTNTKIVKKWMYIDNLLIHIMSRRKVNDVRKGSFTVVYIFRFFRDIKSVPIFMRLIRKRLHSTAPDDIDSKRKSAATCILDIATRMLKIINSIGIDPLLPVLKTTKEEAIAMFTKIQTDAEKILN